MKKEELKQSFRQSLSLFIALAMAIILYFILRRYDGIHRGFQLLKEILTPFLYGGVMAYLLKTPCNFLEKKICGALPEKQKKRAKGLAVLLTLALAVLVIVVLLGMVVPELVSSILSLAKVVPGAIEELSDWLDGLLEGNEVIQDYVSAGLSDLENWLQNWIKTTLLPSLSGVMDGFATTIGSVVSVIYNLGLGFIICVYLLLGRKTFARQGKALLYAVLKPEYADRAMGEIRFVDKTFVGFFGGKILDSAIIGLICYVFCLIMTFAADFKNALLISVIIGVTNIIPYFGPFIGAIPSALLILIDSPVNCVVFVIFIVILQQFDGNILGPRLLANSVGLTGFWVLFAITLFQGLFGFVGILVGVPLFAVIYDIVQRLVKKGLKLHGKAELLEEADEPEVPAEREEA